MSRHAERSAPHTGGQICCNNDVFGQISKPVTALMHQKRGAREHEELAALSGYNQSVIQQRAVDDPRSPKSSNNKAEQQPKLAEKTGQTEIP